jgi:hypothetical protein
MAELASDTLDRRRRYDAAIADAREKDRRAAKPGSSTDRGKPGKLASSTLKDQEKTAAAKLDAAAAADRNRPKREIAKQKGGVSQGYVRAARDTRREGALRTLHASGTTSADKVGTAMAATNTGGATGGPTAPAPKTSAKAPPSNLQKLTSGEPVSMQNRKPSSTAKPPGNFNKGKTSAPASSPPHKKAAAKKKGHSGDPRYTTPPMLKSSTGGPARSGPAKESRADKIKRLNAKSKSMNAEHRASRDKPSALSDSTASDFRKRRGDRVDRRK